MDKLKRMRLRINRIDRELTALFEQRMRVAERIGRYKERRGLPVYDAVREAEVIRRNVGRIGDDRLRPYAEDFYHDLMALTRNYEAHGRPARAEARIGFQGVAGAYSEQAAIAYFGAGSRRSAYPTWEAVFEAIRDGSIDYGVLPIENSSAGAVTTVYDLLKDYDFRIVGEQCITVTHHLLGVGGATIDTVEEVYTHPQAIEQCAGFLRDHPRWKVIPYPNTAASAEFVRDRGDPRIAAIASGRAAELYGLTVLASGVNTASNNMTRFVIVARSGRNDPAANKVSVIIGTAHRAGALFAVLRYFADNGINLLKLESRPIKDIPWESYFYIDFEGNLADPTVASAIELIRAHAAYFRLLGNYRSATGEGNAP